MTDAETPFGERGPWIRTPPPGPVSSGLAARLSEVESRNVTYLGPDFPVFWAEARGANVRDADGNEYVDLTGAFGVAVAGHNHPEVVAAVQEQAPVLTHGMGDVHPPSRKVDLLERLDALLPWPEGRSVLASSGSEAVEIALKTALLATDRPGILAFHGGYHGLTLGALAATAREDFRAPFRARTYAGVRFAPFPVAGREDGEEGATASLQAVSDELDRGRRHGEPVGAILLEPIQGRGGVRVPPQGYLAELAGLAREHGALLVFDEIYTGLGRTGRWFAFEHEGVEPDLLCLGKALGGGLPLSACCGRADVMDAWPPSRGEALHTSTFLGHPLSCAASLAVLRVLERDRLAQRAAELGERVRERLARGLDGVARDIRGRGLFLGVELGPRDGPEVAVAALRRGILILPAGDRGEVVELSPPLVITEAQADEAVDHLVDAIHEVVAPAGV